jgi:hypothetical protein
LTEGISDGMAGVDRHDGRADWTTTLMSYQPPGGGKSSSLFLHDEPWLDFNMKNAATPRSKLRGNWQRRVMARSMTPSVFGAKPRTW